MKRLLSLLLFILIPLLVACGGRSGFESVILGAWEGSSTTNEETYESRWEFFEDGTMILTTYSILDTAAVLTGRYDFEDEDTIAIRQDGEAADTPPGRRDIRMPDENTLILTAPVSGAQAVLKRVQE